MKFLLIVVAVLGIVYVVFIDAETSEDNLERSEMLYQQEMEKAEAVEALLQETVDQRFDEMDKSK